MIAYKKMNNRNGKSLGQYMTPKFVAEFMSSLIGKPQSASILEPDAGEGVFLEVLYEKGFRNVKAYEIDEQMGKRSPIKITYCDFLKIPPKQSFDVVIGNPPYVRWKNIPEEWRRLFKKSEYWNKIMNGLCDLTYAFIYHAVNFLRDYGELIFICPLFWTETVHGKHLRDHLSKNGSVELLINLNEAKVFEQVSSTIIIFKYVKHVKLPRVKIIEYRSKQPVTPLVTNRISFLIKNLELHAEKPDFYIEDGSYRAYLSEQFIGGEPWHPVPPTEKIVRKIDTIQDIAHIGDIAEIGNGMVSGLDAAFKLKEEELKALNEHERGSLIYVYKAKTLERFFPSSKPIPYIFTNHIASERDLEQFYPYFHQKLSRYKEKLRHRYNYAKDIPWWHWVFLRNKGLFERYNVKIFVPSKERYNIRGYFRFALIRDEKDKPFYATQDVTAICVKRGFRESVEYILGLLNSEPIQRWIMVKGFSRGGVYDFSEEPIRTIPIPRINWNNSNEIELHRLIAEVVREILTQKRLDKTAELNNYVKRFIELKKEAKIFPLSVFSEHNRN
uniref:site-specific DNA-methyltransferase (adenine-specific) n=1 Tax=Caldisericum exile TaxID=693075 RepID=A0A7C4TWU8_9BACT